MSNNSKIFMTSGKLILNQAGYLLGHGDITDSIMSSTHGQVVYPAIFGCSGFIPREYLSLCVQLGSLFVDEDEYMKLLVGNDEDSAVHHGEKDNTSTQPFSKVRKDQSTLLSRTFVSIKSRSHQGRTRWWISKEFEGNKLKGQYFIKDDEIGLSLSLLNHLWLILLTPDCEHSTNRPAGDLAQQFSTSLEPRYISPGTRNLFIPAGRSYPHQLYHISNLRHEYKKHVVLHVNGCLACALQFCVHNVLES